MRTRLRNFLSFGTADEINNTANHALAEIFRSGQQIETDRLLLRPRSFLDTEGIFEIDSDEEICRLSLGQLVQSQPEARKRVEQEMSYAQRGYAVPWSVIRKEDRQFLGTCGIVSLNDANGTLGMGFAYRRLAWNQGYGTEALNACIGFLFQNSEFYRIEAQCWPENGASRRVMEKVGMTCEGTLRSSIVSQFGRHDACYYAILRPEWEAKA